MLAHPSFTFHLKGSITADLPARATPVTDPEARRALLGRMVSGMGRAADLEEWLARSPLVHVTFEGAGAGSDSGSGGA